MLHRHLLRVVLESPEIPGLRPPSAYLLEDVERVQSLRLDLSDHDVLDQHSQIGPPPLPRNDEVVTQRAVQEPRKPIPDGKLRLAGSGKICELARPKGMGQGVNGPPERSRNVLSLGTHGVHLALRLVLCPP
jgi:hypothetical protein